MPPSVPLGNPITPPPPPLSPAPSPPPPSPPPPFPPLSFSILQELTLLDDATAGLDASAFKSLVSQASALPVLNVQLTMQSFVTAFFPASLDTSQVAASIHDSVCGGYTTDSCSVFVTTRRRRALSEVVSFDFTLLQYLLSDSAVVLEPAVLNISDINSRLGQLNSVSFGAVRLDAVIASIESLGTGGPAEVTSALSIANGLRQALQLLLGNDVSADQVVSSKAPYAITPPAPPPMVPPPPAIPPSAPAPMLITGSIESGGGILALSSGNDQDLTVVIVLTVLAIIAVLLLCVLYWSGLGRKFIKRLWNTKIESKLPKLGGRVALVREKTSTAFSREASMVSKEGSCASDDMNLPKTVGVGSGRKPSSPPPVYKTAQPLRQPRTIYNHKRFAETYVKAMVMSDDQSESHIMDTPCPTTGMLRSLCYCDACISRLLRNGAKLGRSSSCGSKGSVFAAVTPGKEPASTAGASMCPACPPPTSTVATQRAVDGMSELLSMWEGFDEDERQRELLAIRTRASGRSGSRNGSMNPPGDGAQQSSSDADMEGTLFAPTSAKFRL